MAQLPSLTCASSRCSATAWFQAYSWSGGDHRESGLLGRRQLKRVSSWGGRWHSTYPWQSVLAQSCETSQAWGSLSGLAARALTQVVIVECVYGRLVQYSGGRMGHPTVESFLHNGVPNLLHCCRADATGNERVQVVLWGEESRFHQLQQQKGFKTTLTWLCTLSVEKGGCGGEQGISPCIKIQEPAWCP